MNIINVALLSGVFKVESLISAQASGLGLRGITERTSTVFRRANLTP